MLTVVMTRHVRAVNIGINDVVTHQAATKRLMKLFGNADGKKIKPVPALSNYFWRSLPTSKMYNATALERKRLAGKNALSQANAGQPQKL